MSARVLVPLKEGFEEIEAVTIIDVFIVPDCALQTALDRSYDLVALPGGMPGTAHLAFDPLVREILQRMRNEGQWIAAICAAPAVVLADGGYLEGHRATCHPNFKEKIANYVNEPVVVDGRIITSQAPGTALAFALMLVTLLCGESIVAEIRKSMVY